MESLVNQRINALERHFEQTKLNSFDPYDGLNTPFRKIFFGIKLLERIWLQFIKLFLFNIRSLFGIKKIVHTKSVSDLLSASSVQYIKTNQEEYFERATEYFLKLKSLSIRQNSGIGWGLKFYFTTRFVQADDNTPNLFQTVNALNALLDYYEVIAEKKENRKLKDVKEVKNVIENGLNFILNDLSYTENEQTLIWNYWKNLESPIYNVNALMLGFLSRYKKIFSTNSYDKLIHKTIEFLKSGQNADGSWYYSADAKANFVDGFHTGYILEGLAIAQLNGTEVEKKMIENGVNYYLQNLFTNDNTPKYYNTSIYPIDGQNCAQAIQTLSYIEKLKFVGNDVVEKAMKQIDTLLWNKTGYYNYKKVKFFTYKTSMDRWVNAPMYLALAHLN